MIIGSAEHLKEVNQLYAAVTRHLRTNGIYQWDWLYPNRWVLQNDLKNGHMHLILQEQRCIGAVVVDEAQSPKYASLAWKDSSGKPAVIHRLAVHPDVQGRGIGKALLNYAERLAMIEGFTSIRLDAYTGNPAAIGMYERAGYSPAGEIRYPFRKHPYQCFEKRFTISTK